MALKRKKKAATKKQLDGLKMAENNMLQHISSIMDEEEGEEETCFSIEYRYETYRNLSPLPLG